MTLKYTTIITEAWNYRVDPTPTFLNSGVFFRETRERLDVVSLAGIERIDTSISGWPCSSVRSYRSCSFFPFCKYKLKASKDPVAALTIKNMLVTVVVEAEERSSREPFRPFDQSLFGGKWAVNGSRSGSAGPSSHFTDCPRVVSC